MSRGRVQIIREPASGVALAQCLLARMFPKGLLDVPINSYHDKECRFCDWTDNELIDALKDFNTWAGLTPRSDDPSAAPKYPVEVEAFLTLPAEEQQRLVAKMKRPDTPW